jgi:hypothetical protein
MMAVRFCRAGFQLEPKMNVQRLRTALAMIVVCACLEPALAQTPSPELEACRTTGLMALRERNPAIKDVTLDVDGMTVAKANTKVEDTPIKTIVIGDAYLEKGKNDAQNVSVPDWRKGESAVDVLH